MRSYKCVRVNPRKKPKIMAIDSSMSGYKCKNCDECYSEVIHVYLDKPRYICRSYIFLIQSKCESHYKDR